MTTLDLEMVEIAKVFFQESREGLDVMECVSAGDGEGGWMKRAWVRGRERLLAAFQGRTR